MSKSRSPRRSRYTPTTAREPRVGVWGALLLHGMIVAAAVLTWQHHLEIADQAAPVVPVDLVTIAEKTNIAPTVAPQPRIQPKESPPQVDTPPPKPPPQPTPKAEVAPPVFTPAPQPKPVEKIQAPVVKPIDNPPAPVAKPIPPKPKSDDFNALLNKLTSPAAAPRNAKVADRTIRGVGAMNAMTMD